MFPRTVVTTHDSCLKIKCTRKPATNFPAQTPRFTSLLVILLCVAVSLHDHCPLCFLFSSELNLFLSHTLAFSAPIPNSLQHLWCARATVNAGSRLVLSLVLIVLLSSRSDNSPLLIFTNIITDIDECSLHFVNY